MGSSTGTGTTKGGAFETVPLGEELGWELGSVLGIAVGWVLGPAAPTGFSAWFSTWLGELRTLGIVLRERHLGLELGTVLGGGAGLSTGYSTRDTLGNAWRGTGPGARKSTGLSIGQHCNNTGLSTQLGGTRARGELGTRSRTSARLGTSDPELGGWGW
jgi:hypothetical protein